MQCVTPMFRLYEKSTGDTKRIIPRKEVLQSLSLDQNHIRFQLDKMNQFYKLRGLEIQTIPCGYCWACRLNKSAEWATRIMLETLEHDFNFFITLTYDEEHLPIAEEMSYIKVEQYQDHTEEEEVILQNDGTWTSGTLYPDHMRQFINSLRRKYNREGINNIKFFYCGEYGTETARPHYHLLIFGLPMDLSQNYSYHIDTNFKEHWKNPLIDKYWKYGMHDIANIEWSSAAYVARYTMKKFIDQPKSIDKYCENGKLPEYIRMSRRPGIGMKYYNENKSNIYKTDSMVMKTIKGNTGSFKPPKAFDKKFKEEYPEEWEQIEKKRKEFTERLRKNSYQLADYTDYENLEMAAERVLTINNMLPREGDI